jgi:tetratricopeptide (TPR) repeat protein
MNTMRMMLAFGMMFLLTTVFSQDLNQAGESFNKGIAAQQGENWPAAVAAYEEAISTCSKLGDEGIDLSLKAERQLAQSYFGYGKSLFGEKKYPEALEKFSKAADYATKAADDKTLDASNTYRAGINYALGNNLLKNEDFPGAIEKYNEALLIKPDYYKSYYGLGLVYKKQEDLAKMKENLDKAISMAGTDEKTITNAREAAAMAFRNAGAKSLQAGKHGEAIEQLSNSLVYAVDDPKVYYYMAIAYNGESKWDDAITAANKALELETADKSDIHFELGKSYKGKGDGAAACQSYKSVTGGANVSAAKYQIEQVLKCN